MNSIYFHLYFKTGREVIFFILFWGSLFFFSLCVCMKEANAKTEKELDSLIMTMALFNMGVSFQLTGSNEAELPSHQTALCLQHF